LTQFLHTSTREVDYGTRRSSGQRNYGLVSIRSVLPSIGITKRKLKTLNAIQLVREQREHGTQPLAYNARPFVLCGIPLRRPPEDQLIHCRHSGKFFLEIIAHPNFGLPFGQDRLIPIWVATLALQQKSRVVRFESAAQMLDFFKLPHDGPHYRRMMKGFQRLFAATIFFGTEDEPERKLVIDRSRFHFFDQLRLWFDAQHRTVNSTDAPEGADNVVTLSEAFYSEIDQHRIPVEREVVAALAHAPGILDFYLWTVWKSWTVNGRSAYIPIAGTGGLSQQLGTKEYSLDRRFRHKIGSWLRKVKIFWPECPVTISDDCRLLVIRSSRGVPAIKPRSKA
jgi:hypothetical protein